MSKPGSQKLSIDLTAQLLAADGTVYRLARETHVGRALDCDISIDEERVSRSHALLKISGSQLTVEDLGSANGTWINGRRIEAASELKDGDNVSFERQRFKVTISG